MTGTASSISITVIVPVRNGEATIERCLEAIFSSTVKPREVLVINDSCTDGTVALANRFPCRVIDAPPPGGVAAARNFGAAQATGDVLFFTDADVILMPEAIAAAERALQEGGLDVAVGLQSAVCEFRNGTSVYKNLWLRWTYRQRAGRFSVLYSSAVAIRKSAFERVNGFDTHYQRPNIEDSELGKRLSEAGYRLDLAPELEFLHVKRYNLASMLKTDFHRTVGMIKVQLRDRFRRARRENYTSIPTPFLLSCLAPWAVLAITLAGGYFAIRGWPRLIAAVPLVVLLLNMDWLRYIARREGLYLALKGAVLVHLDIAVVNIGAFWGFLEYATGRKY